MAFVYILRCRDGSLYAGVAKDVARRCAEHQAGKASKYTRCRLPVQLVWFRRVKTWRRALRVEWLIKQLTRREKLALIAGVTDVRKGGAGPRSFGPRVAKRSSG